MPTSHEAVMARIESLYRMLFEHSGYGEMSIEIRFLRKHEKEVLIKCGKQYRFVVPCDCPRDEDCSRCAPQGVPGRERKYKAGKTTSGDREQNDHP